MAAEGIETLFLLFCLFLSYWIMMRKSGMNNCQYVNNLKESVAGWEKVETGFSTVTDNSVLCCTQPFLIVSKCMYLLTLCSLCVVFPTLWWALIC
jgi:hypothetical protein